MSAFFELGKEELEERELARGLGQRFMLLLFRGIFVLEFRSREVRVLTHLPQLNVSMYSDMYPLVRYEVVGWPK